MKLISYLQRNGREQLAVLHQGKAYDMNSLHKDLLFRMDLFLQHWDAQYPLAQKALQRLRGNLLPFTRGIAIEELILLSPVPHPTSCRDGYAFRQRRNRGLPMIPQFDQYPVFYFTNHQSVQGPGEISCMPDHFDKLDFELECAVVICKEGRNIKAKDADGYIGGLMIMNDMSARTLQTEEMLLNLGPAKGKDFATALGPYLVTPDELQHHAAPCKAGHTGTCWDLEMKAIVNGVEVSRGNLKDMDWTFAEIIERASYGVTLYPRDVIGSGTVGTGCFLELNGTRKRMYSGAVEQWLQEDDTIELTIDGLGTLSNTIVKESEHYSILKLKKTEECLQTND